jgi:hypothetical protein
MSPNFLTKFLEEYRELPVLWEVRSADYSNRATRDEAWDLHVQFRREKIPDADLCFAIRASGVIAFRITVSCFTITGFTFASKYYATSQ